MEDAHFKFESEYILFSIIQIFIKCYTFSLSKYIPLHDLQDQERLKICFEMMHYPKIEGVTFIQTDRKLIFLQSYPFKL